jgi:transcriptional regulator with XRE-family HTH domain
MKKLTPEQRAKDVCINIQKMREVRRLTREMMASDLGVSLSTYAKIERCEIELTIKRLFLIADIFETDISHLLESDIGHVFNFHNNQYVQTHGAETKSVVFQSDAYLEKYVKVLEQRVSELENRLGNNK